MQGGQALLAVGDKSFTFARKHDAVAAEAALDGIYIIRTSLDAQRVDAADCVRNYQGAGQRRARVPLAQDGGPEGAPDPPPHGRSRARAHPAVRACWRYVEWHMREAWRELMFADTDQAAKATRDPVAPAKRSRAALDKVERHTLDEGTPVHSFSTFMAELATIVRNTCRTPTGADAPTFDIVTTTLNVKQRQALDLIQQIQPYSEATTPVSRQVLVGQGQVRSAAAGTSV